MLGDRLNHTPRTLIVIVVVAHWSSVWLCICSVLLQMPLFDQFLDGAPEGKALLGGVPHVIVESTISCGIPVLSCSGIHRLRRRDVVILLQHCQDFSTRGIQWGEDLVSLGLCSVVLHRVHLSVGLHKLVGLCPLTSVSFLLLG